MIAKLEQLADQIIETDFLIIGGGLAGLMAAIRAKTKGKIDVCVTEKSHIRTAGEVIGLDGYAGIRHPMINPGIDLEQEAQALVLRSGGLTSLEVTRASLKANIKAAAVVEEIGVKIREDDGTLKMFQQQIVPGGAWKHKPVADPEAKKSQEGVSYRGADLKEKLAIAAEKSGARVFNRTMLTGLITKDGSVVGATCLNIRTGKFLVFKAKVALMATGGAQRMYLYPYAPFPSNLFYGFNFPGNHGGGIAAAYRAGAKLNSMEFLRVGLVSCGMPGGGGGHLLTKNSKGEFLEQKYPVAIVGPGKGSSLPATVLAYMPDMLNPDIEREVLYYDMREATDDDLAKMYFTGAAESPNLLKWYHLRGDPRKAPPFELRELTVGLSGGGIMGINEKGETTLKNLLVAGQDGGGLGHITGGYITGEHAKEVVPEIKRPGFGVEQVRQVKAERKRVFAPLGRKGDSPLELEDYVRKINGNYIGIRKTEARLKRAIELHKIARERFTPNLGAANPHELMRCLEVQDIIDISEMHAYASLIRKESRRIPEHYRVDYPEQDNEHWQKAIILQNVDGEMKYTLEERG